MEPELASVPPPVLDEDDPEAERFFAEGEVSSEGSLAPSALDEELWETPRPVPLDPAVLARRARFRRWVALGLTSGVSALVVLIGATRLTRLSHPESRDTHAAHAQHAPARPVVAASPNPSAALPLPSSTVASAPPSASVAITVPSASVAVTPPSASVAITVPSASVAVTAPTAPTAPNGDARELTRRARTLLASGHTREGVETARSAIDADATLPDSYVLLAAGLQDLGAWKEAQQTFARCAERTGSRECRYFAGGRR